MRKTKRFFALVGVAFVLLTPALGLVPPFEGNASAAPVDNASIDEQVKSYIYIRAIARCLDGATPTDGFNSDRVENDHANDFDWFNNTRNTYYGYLGNDNERRDGRGYDADGGDNDGVENCGNESRGLFEDAYIRIWGFSSGREALCYSGFNEENKDQQPASECTRGTNKLKRAGDAAKDFVKNINARYYGKDSEDFPSMSGAMSYVYNAANFYSMCSPSARDNPDDYTDDEINDSNRLVRMVKRDGTAMVYELGRDDTDRVTTRTNENFGEVKKSCKDLAKDARDSHAAYQTVASSNGGSSGGGSGGGEAAAETGSNEGIGSDCQGALSWVACPIIKTFTTMANQIDSAIMSYLCINEQEIFENGTATCGDDGGSGSADAFKGVWNAFRVLALGLIAAGALFIIISQAFGFDILDAYKVKKTLPRILIAGIGIALSWEIMLFLVQMSNGLGIGIRSLIYAPFQNAGVDNLLVGGEHSLIALILSAYGIVILGPLALLSFLLTGLLALFIALFVLVLRNIVVILLIVLAPVAIAAYTLPNTEKYWKTWWEWTFKALMVFPIITAMIAVGHVFAAVASQRDGMINSIAAFIAYFAPYFMIPIAFRFAGGALATLGGFANDRSRGVFDGLKNFRTNRRKDRVQRAQSNSLYSNSSKAGRIANNVAGWMTDPGNNALVVAGNAGIPGTRRGAARIMGQVEHSRVEQSQKLAEILNKAGYNDKAYRMLSGSHDAFSEETKKRLREEGIFGKHLTSLNDFEKAHKVLSEATDPSEQIAAGAIHGSTGLLASLYKDPELMKADTRAAGIIGLASHGFADGKDLEKVGNTLQGAEGDERSFAHSVITQAQLAGSRGRPDNKAGYGVVYKDGKFVDGMSAEGGRAEALVKSLQSSDLASAKKGAIQKLRPTIEGLVKGGGPESVAVRDQLFSWAGQWSHASADVKAESLKIINDLRQGDGDFAREFDQKWREYSRESVPEAERAGGPPAPPDEGGH